MESRVMHLLTPNYQPDASFLSALRISVYTPVPVWWQLRRYQRQWCYWRLWAVLSL